MKSIVLYILMSLLSLLSFSQKYEITNILTHNYVDKTTDEKFCKGEVDYKKWTGYVHINVDPLCAPYISSVVTKTFIIRRLIMVRDTLGSRIFFYAAITKEDTLIYILSICYTDGEIESVAVRLEHFVIILTVKPPIKERDG